jgi:hypothetical protein
MELGSIIRIKTKDGTIENARVSSLRGDYVVLVTPDNDHIKLERKKIKQVVDYIELFKRSMNTGVRLNILEGDVWHYNIKVLYEEFTCMRCENPTGIKFYIELKDIRNVRLSPCDIEDIIKDNEIVTCKTDSKTYKNCRILNRKNDFIELSSPEYGLITVWKQDIIDIIPKKKDDKMLTKLFNLRNDFVTISTKESVYSNAKLDTIDLERELIIVKNEINTYYISIKEIIEVKKSQLEYKLKCNACNHMGESCELKAITEVNNLDVEDLKCPFECVHVKWELCKE